MTFPACRLAVSTIAFICMSAATFERLFGGIVSTAMTSCVLLAMFTQQLTITAPSVTWSLFAKDAALWLRSGGEGEGVARVGWVRG